MQQFATTGILSKNSLFDDVVHPMRLLVACEFSCIETNSYGYSCNSENDSCKKAKKKKKKKRFFSHNFYKKVMCYAIFYFFLF